MFWWTRLAGLSREAALDLMDGIDDGDSATLSLRLGLSVLRRRRLPTADELARMDAEFQADPERQAEVARRILEDLGRRANEKRLRGEARQIVRQYLAGKN
jgi:hypothetical protein